MRMLLAPRSHARRQSRMLAAPMSYRDTTCPQCQQHEPVQSVAHPSALRKRLVAAEGAVHATPVPFGLLLLPVAARSMVVCMLTWTWSASSR